MATSADEKFQQLGAESFLNVYIDADTSHAIIQFV